MRFKSKKASVFIFILLLINITLIIGYIVFNNIFILNNNINIGKNAEEVFSSIYDKGTINIDTVRKYNGNGNGFVDGISCPTNITMSGSTSSGTNISSQMVYNLGSIYCSGTYNTKEFRIYFDQNFNDFTKAYYEGDIVDIISSTNTIINLSTTNITPSSTKTGTSPWNEHIVTHSADSNINTYFESNNRSTEWLNYDFTTSKSIGKIVIKKDSHWGRWSNFYWDNATIYLYDSSGILLDTTTVTNARTSTQIDIDFSYRGLVSDVKSIKIVTSNRRLDIKEFEIYELLSTGGEELWLGARVFNDADNILISFTSDGIGGGDNFDDNCNSDNYKVTSIDNIYYANGFQDDDVVPRLTIFGSVVNSEKYYNIFWNNYKTNDFIANNTNNYDILNVKIGDVTNGYLYLDLFSNIENINYDMKILEFGRDENKNEFTLLPYNTSEGLNLTGKIGYIQNNSGSLSLSYAITGNEYQFDFKNKDYALFLINNIDSNLSYRITGKTSIGAMIYINPINDSFVSRIESLSNHIIIGGEKNFIGEDFVIVGNK